MPAPTAIQSKSDKQMEIQESGLKEGITLFFVKVLTKGLVDPTEIHIPSNDAEMHIDEENQPHFPPATQTVHTLFIILTIDVIQTTSKTNNDSTSSFNSSTQQLVQNLSASRRTSSAPSTHEYKDKTS